MKILLAPDSFKGSLSSFNFCEIAQQSITTVDPTIDVIKLPLADGGEGTIQAILNKKQGQIVKTEVIGPLGDKVIGEIGVIDNGKVIVLEMASASGLSLIKKEERDPLKATTYGTGQLILKALDYAPQKIIVGIGGSATNDGGAGMLQALGFKLLDHNGEPIDYGAEGLLNLDAIDISTRDKRLDQTEFVVACDVDNPLYGEFGAANIYGYQKGATDESIEALDQALFNFSEKIKTYLDKDVSNLNGAGAAGGLGAGLNAFLNAELVSGFDILKELLAIEKIFQDQTIDYLITGEGEINYQTLNGKLPYEMAKLAKKYQVKTIAVVGQISKGGYLLEEGVFDGIFSIIDRIMTEKEAMDKVEKLLSRAIKNIVGIIKEEQ